MMTTPLDGAIYMHTQGFKVFPVRPNGKAPAITKWQKWAENAVLKDITEYAEKRPTANWGIHCGASGLTIIDIDYEEGKVNGYEVLAELEKEPQRHWLFQNVNKSL